MNKHPEHHQDHRRPEEIEREIERTRAEFSSTIDAIQSKLTPGQLMDQALSYARTSLPADFSANLGNAVRNNPVPVSLIGIGIAWMMMSGQQGQGRASGLHQGAAGSSHVPGTHEEGRLHHAASRASEMGHRLGDTASSMTGRARDMAHDTRARAQELGQRSQERYYRAKDHFNRMADEQPLMVGVLGLAVGTLLGALLPPTRREDELMGHARDDLFDRARETAHEHAPAVKESAHRLAEAARQEFERNADEMSRAHGPGRSDPGSPLPGAADGAGRGSGAAWH